MARYALFGAIAGLVLSFALNAAGLRWLSWLIIGLLVLFALAGTLVLRRARLRKRC